MKISSILRIIDAVKRNDSDMAIRYAKHLIPEEEYIIAEKLIIEAFNPNASHIVMD